jgi:hippurate hydrolase
LEDFVLGTAENVFYISAMAISSEIKALLPDITALRHDIHAHPEIRYEEIRTSKLVAEQLKNYGVDEVITGLGKTGVVALIKGKGASNRGIALRADMDALPIDEISDLAYKSKTPGKMHACGHDGHTAMLLGAARYLASTRNFSGTAVLIFQPAEEGGAGAKAMIDDGLFQRFPIDAIYGMHNHPGLPVGEFAIRSGPMMAASDYFTVTIEGRGAHAARPHFSIDPILIGSHIVTALQSIVSRQVDPKESAVVSVCIFQAGKAGNVIPQTGLLVGAARSFKAEIRDLLEERIKRIVSTTAQSFGASVNIEYRRSSPVLINDPAATHFAASVAEKISNKVDTEIAPRMAGEDFAYLLEQKPGAYILAGNGDTASVHQPNYDFNDALLPYGISYWAKLIETALPLTA